jgi:NADPH2:quinone reductase
VPVSTTAARLSSHSEPVRIVDVELPDPGPDEALVLLAFAAVNPIDTYIARGLVAPDAPLPRTLGSEAAGTLHGAPVHVSHGSLGRSRDGVWATAAVVPVTAIFPLPQNVPLETAASVGVAGITAWGVVVDKAGIGPEDRVLVLGAGGGVGLPIVSLAAGLGAEVRGQVRTAGKADAVRAVGAADVVVTDAAGLRDSLAGWTPTVVIDPLGAGFAVEGIRLLEPRGRYVCYGTSAGAEVTLDLQKDLYRRGIDVLGYGGATLPESERIAVTRNVLTALGDGRMQIPVGSVLPLSEIQAAFELLGRHAVTGKLLLDLSR